MYGLLGEKLSHSFSVQIHGMLSDYKYKLFPMPPEEIEKFLSERRFKGLNVTIPYKKAVIPYCDVLSPEAERIGAVNTITVMDDGMLYGDNTDYFGFHYMLCKSGFSAKGKKALVFGSGGAGKTAEAVLSDMGAHVVMISRHGENNYENIRRHHDADIIINATPVGMYPDTGKSPISLKEFKNLSFVADMIYNPAKTALLLEAEELNIPFVNGLLMLVAQAKKSAESFSGQKIPQSRIDEITSKLSFEMKNIVLIGMPGCGKTTVGEIIAKKLGRDFIDTDRIIEEKAGMTIPEIFKTLGEGHFRALETEVIKEVGKSCSKVISTGGGAVKNLQNKNHLRQNGYVVFIDRDINLLETKGRPLSENAGALKKMYRERFPLYLGFCDISVDGNGEPSDVAEKITAGLL